jgi:hypothetical protein
MHTTKKLEDGYLGSGKLIRRSIEKYRSDQHAKIILEYCQSLDEVKRREREIVTHALIADDLCMNLKIGGEGGGERGVKRSAETRARMSASMKGIPKSPEHAEKMWQAKIGTTASAETRAKMSTSRIGKKLPFSAEHIAKLTEARQNRRDEGRDKHNLGRKFPRTE